MTLCVIDIRLEKNEIHSIFDRIGVLRYGYCFQVLLLMLGMDEMDFILKFLCLQ